MKITLKRGRISPKDLGFQIYNRPMEDVRARNLGWITPPLLDSGPQNALTDVPGVLVGHTTIHQTFQVSAHHSEQGSAEENLDSLVHVHTGVTAIRPHPGNIYTEPVAAAVHVLNAFGKTTGLEQIRELGTLEAPILLTNTLNVWRCADYLVDWMLRDNPGIGINTRGTVNPVVGECSDSWLSDIQGRHVTREHVFAALDSASAYPVAEGNVGAGAGTVCYGFKGGIGTASRVLPHTNGGFTVGVLLQSNFGAREQLIIRGQPVGQWLPETFQVSENLKGLKPEGGSCMMIIAADAPLSTRQLGRLARRAPLGLARTGFTSNPGSGDYVIAFSTTHRKNTQDAAITRPVERLSDEWTTLGLLIQGVVEATEEAVLNSLVAATTVVGREEHTAHRIPIDKIQQLLTESR
jgi:D-aminopeptidase